VGNLPPASMAAGLQEVILHPGERIKLVCGASHPLVRCDEVKLDDLNAFMFVLPPLGSAFRVSVDAVMAAMGVEYSRALVESGSMTATNTFIRETEALSFYSEHLAAHYARMGAIKELPLDIPNLTAPIGMVWMEVPGRREALELFQHCLVEQTDSLFDTGGITR
jgi:DNA-binding transcriptional LysR family regulator